MGVFSTREHPFCLVYEYMDGLDVGQYLKNAHNTRRMNLVILLHIHPPTICESSHLLYFQVADIAQDLSRMHSMGIAHGCLQMVHPFLVLLTLIAQPTYVSRKIS